MTDFAVFAQQFIDELTKESRKYTADTRSKIAKMKSYEDYGSPFCVMDRERYKG